jgi:hypothetical protein
LTGSAVDVLPSSAAEITNCLFVDNVGNRGVDDISPSGESYNAEHGSGALTVFPGSRVRVQRCTFTGNWNGIDDKGRGNVYQQCIFWQNNRPGGLSPKGRYELDILHAVNVRQCAIAGESNDLRGTIDSLGNFLNAPDPQFDADFRPKSPEYAEIGYRPVSASTTPDVSRSAPSPALAPGAPLVSEPSPLPTTTGHS